MDRKPGRPGEQQDRHDDRPSGGGPEHPAAGPHPAADRLERSGPVSLRRLRKEDGRALIVYSRESPSP